MSTNRLLRKLLGLEPPERLTELRKLSEEERQELRFHWQLWARAEQLPPPGDWRLWLILAGRGFGKTRAGAEWVRRVAETTPAARIALVAASLGEGRAVMVEGESGLLETASPRSRPQFEPSLRRLTWPRRRASSTKWRPGSTHCCTWRLKPRPLPRRPARSMGSAG